MQKIDNVIGPYAYTDKGHRYHVKDLKGQDAGKGKFINDNNEVVAGEPEGGC